jgi:hypothetical protein
MARKGRDLELLIQSLEKMDLTGATIKSPDFIFDKVADEEREVDVSIRTKVGSHDILIIFECRDHKSNNGPAWIEQLIQKTKDLGANKVVAVSSSGFTNAAKRKAKQNNIELRTVQEITYQEIFSWFSASDIPVISTKYVIKEIFLDSEDPNLQKDLASLENYEKQLEASFKFISQDEGKTLLSIHDLFSRVKEKNNIFSCLNEQQKRTTVRVKLTPEDNTGYLLVVDDCRIRVNCLIITLELWLEETQYNLSSKKVYKNDDKTLSQVLTFTDETTKRAIRLLLKEAGDEKSIVIQAKNIGIELNKQ